MSVSFRNERNVKPRTYLFSLILLHVHSLRKKDTGTSTGRNRPIRVRTSRSTGGGELLPPLRTSAEGESMSRPRKPNPPRLTLHLREACTRQSRDLRCVVRDRTPSSRARRGGASRAGTGPSSFSARAFSGRIDRMALRLPHRRASLRDRRLVAIACMSN